MNGRHTTTSNDLPRVRAATLNTYLYPGDRSRRLEAAALEAARLNLDFISLQELSPGAADTFAQVSGMRIAAVVELPGGMCNAVLTTMAVEDSETVIFGHCSGDLSRRGAAVAVLRGHNGRRWVVVSAHLEWGSTAEGARLMQAQTIERIVARREAAEAGTVTVLGGDLNTGPESATVRYLLGLDPNWTTMESTLWVDAHRFAGNAEPTSVPTNSWAASAAATVGITAPSMLPDRRIDFLLVRGYAYGRPGCPLSASLAFDKPCRTLDAMPVQVSDHYGVYGELWNPAL